MLHKICLFSVCAFGLFLASAINIKGQTVQTNPDATPNPPGQRAASPVLTAREHPWGHCLPGSWRRMQTTTWTTQGSYSTSKTKETKTTLLSIDETNVTLEESSTVFLGGQWHPAAPAQKTRVDFFQMPVLAGTVISQLPPHTLTVNNRLVPCECRSYKQKVSQGVQTTTIWYTAQIAPYIFRMETILRSLPTNDNPVGRGSEPRILNQSVTEVVDTAAFFPRNNRFAGTYRLRTISRSGAMTMVTETSCSQYVPGGVYQETIRELDGAGKEIRKTETRLINYYCLTPPEQRIFSSRFPFEPTHVISERQSSGGQSTPSVTQPTPTVEPIPWFGRPRWRRVPVVPGANARALPY